MLYFVTALTCVSIYHWNSFVYHLQNPWCCCKLSVTLVRVFDATSHPGQGLWTVIHPCEGSVGGS